MLHGQNPVEIQIRFDQREFYRVLAGDFCVARSRGFADENTAQSSYLNSCRFQKGKLLLEKPAGVS